MRREILEQLFAPRITLRDVEDALRKVILDPLKCEEKVGMLYGAEFKKREAVYDARHRQRG